MASSTGEDGNSADAPDEAEISEALDGVPPGEYGGPYEDHVLKQYELLVAAADKISDRRSRANAFFVTINTAIIGGVLGFSGQVGTSTLTYLSMGMGLLGGLICYAWFRLIGSYKAHNNGKFAVIHLMEDQLPLRPYKAEWLALGEGESPEIYRPFTETEERVPVLFMVAYSCAFLISLGVVLWPFVASLL